MKFKIFYHSHSKNEGFESVIQDYQKRLNWKIEFENYINRKSKIGIIEELSAKYFVIALSENGTEFNSVDFSKYLEKISANFGGKIAFVIGAAEGFDKQDLKKANNVISLSKLTFPHNMARLMLVEQMYRAWTILENKPYHK
ncbi:MAG: 23S rRNA (pseudouridine(1915)-N(3))-methyltransferase RlmH [Rickettsiales bacterium]|nr:23S rRNA (pseudouridine(1915)-N(3))-methyltransferase RlmH [Rickettsiales bacterium]